MILGLYTLLATALFYLGSRAKITSWLWSRYPHDFASFMDCSACTGFWWGFFAHLTIGVYYDCAIGPMPANHPATPIVVGLCTLVLTPMVAGLMQRGLELTGSAVD